MTAVSAFRFYVKFGKTFLVLLILWTASVQFILYLQYYLIVQSFVSHYSCAPPPPPSLSGSIPARRIQTQPQPEMPSCVQNAMMTKDKKPFTYTPGGIDLSQIKSPRMARRIHRNANMEGVSNQPKPSPLAGVSQHYTSKWKCTFSSI